MKTLSNELFVYYDPGSIRAKKVLAYARGVAQHVKEVEYHKTKLTPTLWKQLLFKLDSNPKNLLNKAHPYYQSNIRGREFDDEGWLKILINNPDLIKCPIVVKGEKAILCNNPTDILQL